MGICRGGASISVYKAHNQKDYRYALGDSVQTQEYSIERTTDLQNTNDVQYTNDVLDTTDLQDVHSPDGKAN